MEDKLLKGGNYKRFKKGSKPEYGNSAPENFVHPPFIISGSAPAYLCAYLPTFLPTYPYVHNSIRIVPIVPHPTFSGSQWSSFRYELKSVPVRFGTHWSPFRSVSVTIEVRVCIFVGPLWSVLVCFGPFRSVSVSRDTMVFVVEVYASCSADRQS